MAERFSFSGFLRGAFLENLGLKFVALVLALTVFILVHSDEDAVAGAYVNISYMMPENRVLVSDRLDQVRITVKGSWRRVKRFDENALDPIRIDLRKFRSGDLIFRSDMFRVPPGLTIESIDPTTMELQFEPRAEKRVPVVAKTSGEPARGYGVAELVARVIPCDSECDTVLIEGAERAIAQTTQVETEDVSLVGRSGSFTADVGVVPPRPFVKVVGEPTVRVDVQLVEELTTRELGSIPVAVRAGSGVAGVDVKRFATEPLAVDVVLRGAKLAVEQVVPNEVEAYVEVYADDAVTQRTRRAAVVIEGVPQGVAIELNPRDVQLSRATP